MSPRAARGAWTPGPDMAPPAKAARPSRPVDERPAADDRSLAVLAHALAILTGFIAPLVLWLARKDSPVIEPHAREALNFQLTLLLALAAAIMLVFVVVGWFLLPIVLVAGLVFSILGAQAAYLGRPYRYPVSLRLVPPPGHRQA